MLLEHIAKRMGFKYILKEEHRYFGVRASPKVFRPYIVSEHFEL